MVSCKRLSHCGNASGGRKTLQGQFSKTVQGEHDENPLQVPAERMFGGEQETKGFV